MHNEKWDIIQQYQIRFIRITSFTHPPAPPRSLSASLLDNPLPFPTCDQYILLTLVFFYLIYTNQIALL